MKNKNKNKIKIKIETEYVLIVETFGVEKTAVTHLREMAL
jgi:protein involved in ribonucleotide reduction